MNGARQEQHGAKTRRARIMAGNKQALKRANLAFKSKALVKGLIKRLGL